MRRKLILSLLMVLVTCASASRADSYGPFLNFRLVESTGQYYLVVTRRPGGPGDPGRGTPVDYVIVECRPGSQPVAAAIDRGGVVEEVARNPEVCVRDGDLVHGRGKLDRVPRQILLSSTGLGFVGIDVAGYNYGDRHSGNALVIVSQDGEVRHRKDLAELFDEAEIVQFMETAGGICWSGGGWIDEKRGEVIVVGSQRDSRTGQWPLRSVNLETGKVTRGSTGLIVTALSEVNRGALNLALGLAKDLKLEEARPWLVPLLENPSLPILTRLKAASSLAVFGDFRGANFVRTVAFSNDPFRYDAIRLLPEFFGEQAAPMLRDLYRALGKPGSLPVWQAMCELKEKAEPTLIEMLNDWDHPELQEQEFAAGCVYSIGTPCKGTVPALIAILRSQGRFRNDRKMQRTIATALGNIGPDSKEALPELRKLAKLGKAELDAYRKAHPQEPHPIKDLDGWEQMFEIVYFDDEVNKAIARIQP